MDDTGALIFFPMEFRALSPTNWPGIPVSSIGGVQTKNGMAKYRFNHECIEKETNKRKDMQADGWTDTNKRIISLLHGR